MKWFAAQTVKSNGHDCREVLIATSGRKSNRRYVIGRFETGLGWKDESGRTIVDAKFYALIEPPKDAKDYDNDYFRW